MLYNRIKGTVDIYDDEIKYWYWIENNAREIARLFGYREMRTPIFEQANLFVRSVGEGTDIVQKEMYKENITQTGGNSRDCSCIRRKFAYHERISEKDLLHRTHVSV